MRAIVVEDEINVRKGFIKMIHTFCEDLEVVGEADRVESGLMLIENTEFELLFLDINLPDGSGFDLLQRLGKYNFKVIFVTAYDQYAISAFKMSAVDYLLKPVSPDILEQSVMKAKAHQTNQEINAHQLLTQNLHENKEKKIVLKDLENIYIVQLSDIVYCRADGCYTVFTLQDGKSIITSTILKEYETMLEIYSFIRCHHSYLINLDHVAMLNKTDGWSVAMDQGDNIPVSKRKKPILLDKINSLFIN